jgi:hypothetical protein
MKWSLFGDVTTDNATELDRSIRNKIEYELTLSNSAVPLATTASNAFFLRFLALALSKGREDSVEGVHEGRMKEWKGLGNVSDAANLAVE